MRVILKIFLLLFCLMFIHKAEAQTFSNKRMEPTPSLTEGPFYKAGSPEKSVLYSKDDIGQIIILEGRVFDKNGKALSGVWIDFWQADARGTYDNRGYRFRGHTYTDSEGKYKMETMLPGDYSGRTQHIHVKLKYAENPVLTTQLFFPNQSLKNSQDTIFNSKLVVKMKEGDNTAAFDFVLD